MSDDNTPEKPNLEEVFGITETPLVFDEQQEAAIAACCDLDRRIVAVTGRAGTGKTSIIKEVACRLKAAGYIVQTSAPTGKAAKRIREATGEQAMTNHRMLGFGMPIEHEYIDEKTGNKKYTTLSTGPRYKRSNPMIYDTVAGDEYAMVTQELNRNIIDALKVGGRILMFGDVNQLKPIEEDKRLAEAPSAFQDALIRFNGITLETNHRQNEGSGIAMNGADILKGRIPKRYDDFDVRYTKDPNSVPQEVQDFVMEQLDLGHDYATPSCQIITCMNKSWVGTKKLNLSIQSLFWKRDMPVIDLPRHKWEGEGATIRVQVGSKVVYTANTYDLGNGESVFNGEVGTIVAINYEEESFDIDLGDRIVTIPPFLIVVKENGDVIETDPRKNVDLAYVLTTHKMQGSEVDRVCYIINKSTLYGQSRRNLYTAITRARKHCTLMTDQHSIQKSTKFPG